jgi:hypothetical protein
MKHKIHSYALGLLLTGGGGLKEAEMPSNQKPIASVAKAMVSSGGRGENVTNMPVTSGKGGAKVATLCLPTKPQPQFGSCEGMLVIVSDDDEHLEHFKDYMP